LLKSTGYQRIGLGNLNYLEEPGAAISGRFSTTERPLIQTEEPVYGHWQAIVQHADCTLKANGIKAKLFGDQSPFDGRPAIRHAGWWSGLQQGAADPYQPILKRFRILL
jgi:hypothetical protein